MKSKKELKLVNYHDYISNAGLNGLKVLEGHKKTEKVYNNETGKYEITGLYGIKQSCIDEVKRYAKQKGFDITEAMSKVKNPWDLTEESARDFAGYYAWRNYNFANVYTNDKFSDLDQHQKDVLLSYFHNMSLEKLNKNRGSKGSMLDAIEMGDPDEIMKRLFMKADGTFGTYEDSTKSNRRGLMNRYMATAQWYYNPETEVLSSFEKRDEYYRDIYPSNGYLNMILNGINSMQAVNKKYRDTNAMADFDVYANNQNTQEQAEQPVAEPKQPQKRSFWQTLGDIAMAISNPMAAMVQNQSNNQLANTPENMLNKENGAEQ